MLYSNGDLDGGDNGRYAHQWLTFQAHRMFYEQFGASEIDQYIGKVQRYPNGPRTTVIAGVYNEDHELPSDAPRFAASNPFGDAHPSLRHFWDRSSTDFHRTFDDGLGPTNDSAANRAIKYFTGGDGLTGIEDLDWGIAQNAEHGVGITASYLQNRRETAYYWLGHVAHLLQDMSVPAHANDDPHLEGYGVFDQPDPFHDWVDGVEFSPLGAGADGRPPAAFVDVAPHRYQRWGYSDDVVRSPLELAEMNTATQWRPEWTASVPAGAVASSLPLYHLFLETAGTADNFDSKDYNGQVDNGNRRGPVDGFGFGFYDSWTEGELKVVANAMVPRAIKATAELFRYFYSKIDFEAPIVTVPQFSGSTQTNPDVVVGSDVAVSADALDFVSGVERNGFTFRFDRWNGTDWTFAREVSRASDTEVITGLADGLYRLVASVRDGAGVLGTAPSVYLQVQTAGAVAPAQTGQHYGGTVTPTTDTFHTFAARAGDTLIVALNQAGSPSGFQPLVDVRRPDGTPLITAQSARFRTTLAQAGQYTLRVYSGSATLGGSYGITVLTLPGRDVGSDAGTLPNNQTRSASIESLADMDLFTFPVSAGESVVISMGKTSGPFVPTLDLYAPDGTLVTSRTATIGGATLQLLEAAKGGVYSLVVGASKDNATGSYALTMAKLPDEFSDASLAAGDNGELLGSGSSIPGALSIGDIDVFTMHLAAGERLLVSLAPPRVGGNDAAEVVIFAPNGQELFSGTSWDSFGGVLYTGTYYFVVRETLSDRNVAVQSGNYQISALRMPGAQVAGGDGVTLRNGQVANGSASRADFDVFTLFLKANETATLTVNVSFNPPWPQVFYYRQGDGAIGWSTPNPFFPTPITLSTDLPAVYSIVVMNAEVTPAAYSISVNAPAGLPSLSSLIAATRGGGLYLRRNLTDATRVDAWLGVLDGGQNVAQLSESIANLNGLSLTPGSDELVLDFSGGAPLPAGAVVDGLAGDDSLLVRGTAANDAVTFAPAGFTLAGQTIGHGDIEHLRFAGNGGQEQLTVTGGPTVFAAAALPLTALTITGSGRVNLGAYPLLLDYTAGSSPIGSFVEGSYSGVTGFVAAGRNDGTWSGPGLVTDRAAATGGLMSLGVAEARDVLGISGAVTATWNGVTVDPTTVLVRNTYAGDANIDGIISGDDYAAIDFNMAVAGASGWGNGDFNYDGIISGDDYSMIDFNIVAQGPPLTAATFLSAAEPEHVAPASDAMPAADTPTPAVASATPAREYGTFSLARPIAIDELLTNDPDREIAPLL